MVGGFEIKTIETKLETIENDLSYLSEIRKKIEWMK